MTESQVEGALLIQLAASRGITRAEVIQELEQSGGVIDSLEGLELLTEAERTFDILVSDAEIASGICGSILEVVSCVQSKVALAN